MVHSGGRPKRRATGGVHAAARRQVRAGEGSNRTAATRQPWRVTLVATAFVAAAVLARPAVASAQAAVGFQGGVAVDSTYPEQIFGGVFFQTGDLGRGIRLRPGIDGATGEGLRIGTVNLDLVYGYPLGANGWTLVAGGGPTIVITRVPGLDSRDTAVGFHSLLGFGHDSGAFVELRLGSGRAQELKLGVGWAIAFD